MSQEYTNISDLPLLDNITPSSYIPVEKENSENVKEGYKVDLNTIKPGTLNTDNSNSQATKTSESLSGTVNLHKVAKTGSYTDLNNKPTIPSVGKLNTNNTTSQEIKTSELLNGTVKLHKIAKTGSYNDLLNKPILNTNNTGWLNPSKNEELSDTINLHMIAKTGSWSVLENKPYGYDLASCNDDPRYVPASTVDWDEGEPLRIEWSTVTDNTEPSKYGGENHQVLDTSIVLNFDDSHLLERGESYPANFDGSTEIIIHIDPSFDFTYTAGVDKEYTGIVQIVDLYARIVGRDDTRYDTTHPLRVVIGSWVRDEINHKWVFVEKRELTCINPTSTLDITKDGYIRITGLMTYEIVQL